MHPAPRILDGVVNRFVEILGGDAGIGGQRIGEDIGPLFDVRLNLGEQRLLLGVGNNLRLDLAQLLLTGPRE
jgi:hypothetical protein